MRASDDESAGADEIAGVAEDLGAVLGVRGDLATVLEVLGVPKENGTGDLLADGGVDISNSSGSESSTLTVSSSNDDSVGALLVGIVEVANHLSDGSGGSSTREGVLADASSVSTADTLNPDSVPAILALELGSNSGTQSTQVAKFSGATSEDEDDTGAAARVAILEIVAGAAELASLKSRFLGRGEGRSRGGEKSGSDRELHCDYW
jgi:hypothetical protein